MSGLGASFAAAVLSGCGLYDYEAYMPVSRAEPINIKTVDPKPVYEEGDVIPFFGSLQMVSCRYILRTGKVPLSDDPFTSFNMEVDLSSVDPFTLALNAIYASCLAAVKKDKLLSDLLRKSERDYMDKVQWEENLSQIVSSAVARMPGLKRYRSSSIQSDIIHPKILNMLSGDIISDSTTVEFDCDTMSVVEGILLQSLEDAFLSEEGHPSKRPRYILCDLRQYSL